MYRVFRLFLAPLLAVLIALTGLHIGALRGQSMAVGAIVICTGTGPVSIAVDAEGQPTGRSHVCPDCVMTLLLGLEDPQPCSVRTAQAQPLYWNPNPRVAARAGETGPFARGPPVPHFDPNSVLL